MRVRAEWTQYAVPDWGVGELWTEGDLVLVHEFRFGSASEADVGTGTIGRSSSSA